MFTENDNSQIEVEISQSRKRAAKKGPKQLLQTKQT